MRSSFSVQLYTLLLLCLAIGTSAWPVWPRWLPDLDSLVVRADSTSSSSASATATASKTSGSSTASETGTASKTAASATGTNSASTTEGTSGNATTTATGSGSTHTTYNATVATGGISMLTPSAAAATYYRIGEYVTFVWNYTSLSATPTAVDILATCTANSQLYTIQMNATVPGNSTQAVTWDTGSYQSTAVSNPLLTETYTLIIYEAGSSISATAEAGYLGVYDTFTFGMYTPQPYVGLGEYVCATCSGALSDMERRALRLVIGVSLITVASFTWFVSGTGVIW